MNILLIGNGFDLAHGLPTRYTDFLEFCRKVRLIFADSDEDVELDKQYCGYIHDLNTWKINQEIKEKLIKAYESRIVIEKDIDKYGNIHFRAETQFSELNQLNELIKNNFWLDYFRQNCRYRKENWIDFEKEISKVIKSLDNDMHCSKGTYSIDDNVTSLSNSFLEEKYYKYILHTKSIGELSDGKESESITFKEIRNKLLDDLNKLIRAFEIYLVEYVEKIDINIFSPDIRDIITDALEYEDKDKTNKILSFNYTNTYERIYDIAKNKKSEYDFIHGKAESSSTLKLNNMVLGIDEYLSKKRRNKEVEFIEFKKYYQRIHKQTGCQYREWMDIIKKRKHYQHYLYIFGHSLDISDKDVLKDLILNDNVYTTIFYLNKDVMGQQIMNLVKVIGQDELIKRTGGNTKTIEFKQQKDMMKKR